MFSIEFSNTAKKFLKELSRRLIERIEKLILDPFPSDVKRIEFTMISMENAPK